MAADQTHSEPGDTDSTPVPKVVPVIQVLGIVVIAGLAVADLVVEPSTPNIPWTVYVLIGAIVVGVAPENLPGLAKAIVSSK